MSQPSKRTFFSSLLFLFTTLSLHFSASESNAMNCNKCKKSIANPDTGITCEVCDLKYHIASSCSGIPSESIPAIMEYKDQFCWKCKSCKNEKVPSNVERVINKLIEKFETKTNNRINLLESEVKRCKKSVTSVAASCKSEHQIIDDRYYDLELQLHRPNILISNIPKTLNVDPAVAATNIAHHLGFSISQSDISQCFFLNKNKDIRTILLKFSTINLRDEIMSKYWSTKNLVLADVFETDIRARIYLNDHLPSKLAALRGLSSKLKKKGSIKKFRINLRSGSVAIFQSDDDPGTEYKTLAELKDKFPDSGGAQH